METSEQKIPNYVFEDPLFQRKLYRTINEEQERLNALLSEHARLLEARRQVMADSREAVQRWWKEEEAAASNLYSVPMTDEDADAD